MGEPGPSAGFSLYPITLTNRNPECYDFPSSVSPSGKALKLKVGLGTPKCTVLLEGGQNLVRFPVTLNFDAIPNLYQNCKNSTRNSYIFCQVQPLFPFYPICAISLSPCIYVFEGLQLPASPLHLLFTLSRTSSWVTWVFSCPLPLVSFSLEQFLSLSLGTWTLASRKRTGSYVAMYLNLSFLSFPHV